MLNIVLCDDDPFILRLGAEQIRQVIDQERLDAALAAMVQDSTELFAFVRRNPGELLVFLDLDFGQGKLNGIDIAKALRQMDPGAKVVFATNHQELAMEVLKSGAEPFGFLEKGSDIAALGAGYRRYIRMALRAIRPLRPGDDLITLPVGLDEEVTLRRGEIVFVETEKNISHGITYHTLSGSQITLIGTLEEAQQRLGADFIRVHRSYLVQAAHILGLKNGYLRLSTQQEVPCALRKRNEVKKWIDSASSGPSAGR